MAREHPTASMVIGGGMFLALGAWLTSDDAAAYFLAEHGQAPAGTHAAGVACLVLAGALVMHPLAALTRGSEPTPTVRDDGGERSVLIKRGWPRYAARVAVLVASAAFIGAMLWAWTGSTRTGQIIIGGLLGAGLLSYLVPVALGRHGVGHLRLTPTAIVNRHQGLDVTIAWDDVARVDVASGGVVVGARRSRAVTATRLFPIWTDARPYPSRAFLIPTEGVRLDPAWLARVIEHYAVKRTTRHELGTPASLVTIDSLRRAPAADGASPVSQLPPEAPPTYPTTPRHPGVTVKVAADGTDALDILTRTDRALRKAGVPKAERAEYWDDAVSRDLTHLVATTRAWVTVVPG